MQKKTDFLYKDLEKKFTKSKMPYSRKNKVGLPPGTPIFIGKEKQKTTFISLSLFDSNSLETKELDLKEVLSFLASMNKNLIYWLDITGLQQVEIIQQIADFVDLPALLTEDILNTTHRSKIDFEDDLTLIIMKMMQATDAPLYPQIEQISIILKRNLIITFRESKDDTLFAPIIARLKKNNSKIHTLGATYACYCLVDLIIDHYFIVVENLDQQIDCLEEIASTASIVGNEFSQLIDPVKKIQQKIRYNVTPLREFIGKLQFHDSNNPFAEKTLSPYLNDLKDHINQIIENIDNDRETITNIQNLQMANVSNRLNQIMKFLTILSAIFIPLTFLTGVYGMNFIFMPGLTQPYAFYFLMVIMAVVACSMYLIFKFHKWL